MTTVPPVLWQFRFSHFNEKARWALDWKGIPHVRRALLVTPSRRAVLLQSMPAAGVPGPAGAIPVAGGAGGVLAVGEPERPKR